MRVINCHLFLSFLTVIEKRTKVALHLLMKTLNKYSCARESILIIEYD